MNSPRSNSRSALSREERLAIATLKRLAKRWPPTLQIMHGGSEGSTLLVKRACPGVDPIDLETIVQINGFRMDSTS